MREHFSILPQQPMENPFPDSHFFCDEGTSVPFNRTVDDEIGGKLHPKHQNEKQGDNASFKAFEHGMINAVCCRHQASSQC
ncbi:hypothetical protein [Noviherbaspirillum sp. L7-7A]|uniref:hypothetical protein n=1 Tax=Noviherbaspirillum sp. L7-7A TaxID=2850560 RepID=UPI002011562A|nr:hypothetical protein [Noviherbaspirillum sp. L7-7A]